jgi:hypothetical protein
MSIVIVEPKVKAYLGGPDEQRQAAVMIVEALISYGSLCTQSADS